MLDRDLYRELGLLFDETFYLARNGDVRQTGIDPLEHYILYGAAEGRLPCRFFDPAWYMRQYPDVARAGMLALAHYIRHGGQELRNPHPRFDAAFYVDAHPQAWGNPLLYHQLAGERDGLPTERPFALASYLPSTNPPVETGPGRTVDIVIPVYRGLAETRRCVESVLTDPARPPGRVIVIDDMSPEPRLSAWLARQAARGRIHLLRNRRNLGFVGSANRGMREAGRNDVVLLNADTEVPPGWLVRLSATAFSAPDIASVSPLSNNATICSYPSQRGGPLPPGLRMAEVDAACRVANAGRAVALPTTVGFCMYLRRAALEDVGSFDAAAFGRGYGEEVDFCQRARARGWRHLLALDVFVFHEGAVSFGPDAEPVARVRKLLADRYPNYEEDVGRFARLDPAGPARFALTAALLRAGGLPAILMIGHGLGGGVRRHLNELTGRLAGRANVLLLEPETARVRLSFPTMPDQSAITLGEEQVEDLAALLRSANVQRLHVHHIMGLSMDLRALVRALDMPFDLTVHDYFTLCPQINFLPYLDAQYCGEPDARHCNACLAANPADGAHDIQSWRHRHAWLFQSADRVICPSADVRDRLARFGLAENAIIAPHEPVEAGNWRLAPPRLGQREKLRVALLGVLADRKGYAMVTAVAELAGPDVEFHLIGYPEKDLPSQVADRFTVTGPYEEPDLPDLIQRVRPHLVWFPAQWPETYSYTLSAALAAGAPILATRIGAFPGRLDHRPLTWLLPHDAPPQAWLGALREIRGHLRPGALPARRRPAVADFYAADYAAPFTQSPAPVVSARQHSLARSEILLLPERLSNGAMSPCAHIRLLQPLNHLAIAEGFGLRLGDLAVALRTTSGMIVTHRHALPSAEVAEELADHCRKRRVRLVYDLDDDLLDVPEDHPEASLLRPRAKAIAAMLRAADEVWVSTGTLAAKVGATRRPPRVIPNGLDERIWWPAPANLPPRQPIRLLLMGTATHGPDFAMVAPALERLAAMFGPRISIEMIGMTMGAVPSCVGRVHPPASAASYPAFVNWLSQENRWHIGLAPLADTPFNRAKSAIKAMDYAALGIPTVASAIGVYDGAVRDGESGLLVANTEAAWVTAVAGLIRDPARREHLAAGARQAFAERFSLASQAAARRKILLAAAR